MTTSSRDLVSLAAALSAVHERARAHIDALPVPAAELRRAIDEQTSLLRILGERVGALEQRRATVHDTVADRMNNVLMSVQTVADLLKRPQNGETFEDLRQRLHATVETGRDALRRIQAGLAELE